MGVGDSKSQFKHGHIILQTSKPYFEPGEEVTGNIYLYLNQPFPGSNLQIELSGKEKTGWQIRKQRGKRSYTKHLKGETKIFDFNAPIYTFLGGAAVPGQYNFPFKILLPSNIPSSWYYTNNIASRPHAKVKYKLKAIFQSNDKNLKDMTFKQTLVIRQQPGEMPISSKAEYEDQVNTWCWWISKGVVKIESQTDKTAYTPSETAKIMASIDNSNCKADIQKIKVQLIQKINLKAQRKHFSLLEGPDFGSGDHKLSHSEVLLEKEYPGLLKGEETDGMDRFMELPLSEYDYKPDKNIFSGGLEEKDDKYMAKGLQPNVDGLLVQISYILRIEPDYSSCWVCNHPGTQIGIFISPPRLPSYQKLEAPSDWNPQVFDSKNFAAPVPNIKDEF